jgi:DNA polymerase-3 subunit delta'
MLLNNDIMSRFIGRLDRIPHALLLHGPQGVGKLDLAERLAQRLLCETAGKHVAPCGKCDGCRWFAAGNHPDIRFVEPETMARTVAMGEEEGEERAKEKRKPSTEIRIEQVRALADFLNLGSHRARRRIALVHPAEDMNAVAANALLKSLEEPPPGAMFLMVSHRPARLLPTIRSRCVAVPVSSPARETARQWLEAQGVRDAQRWLAFAGGAPRRALDFAVGEQSARAHAILGALTGGDDSALLSLGSREEVELLVDALQKQAFDCAFIAQGLAPKYGLGTAAYAGKISCRQWLAYARSLGRARVLARHPLNPRLFAAERLADRS